MTFQSGNKVNDSNSLNLTRICDELKGFFTVNTCSTLLSDVQRIFSGCIGCLGVYVGSAGFILVL